MGETAGEYWFYVCVHQTIVLVMCVKKKRPKMDVQKMIGENKSVMGFNLIWFVTAAGDF